MICIVNTKNQRGFRNGDRIFYVMNYYNLNKMFTKRI